MALIHLDHVPETVKVNSPVYLIVPDRDSLHENPIRERKVLYLLHGLSDDGSAWQRFTTIENVARKFGIVVVMPSAGRSFYINQPNGLAYFSYITEELPDYLEKLLGLSRNRDQNMIAGNSMGGYGAMKAALLHPEQYFAAASFSGVLSLQILSIHANDPRNEEFRQLFGDLSSLNNSNHDPLTWLQAAAKTDTAIPDLYISCGRQDDLYPLQGIFQQACLNLGVSLTAHEENAGHTWSFWDREISRFLSHVMPVESKKGEF